MRRILSIPVLLVFSASVAPAQGAPLTLENLEKKLPTPEGAFVFVRNAGLGASVRRFADGAKDVALSTERDTLYQVVSGEATIEIAGKPQTVRTGSLVFAAAGSPRRVVEVEGGLVLMTVASGAVAHSGGMAAALVRPTGQTPYPETSPRGSTRIFYWFGPGSAGQVEVDYGLPAWNKRYESFMTQPKGRRWRFGQNFWTRLDTNIDLTIGGVKVPTGLYYLVLENAPGKGPRMVALDPKGVRSQLLDAYQAPTTKYGIVIPLQHEPAESHAGHLRIRLDILDAPKDSARLTIHFGPHLLTAPLQLHPRK